METALVGSCTCYAQPAAFDRHTDLVEDLDWVVSSRAGPFPGANTLDVSVLLRGAGLRCSLRRVPCGHTQLTIYLWTQPSHRVTATNTSLAQQ